MLLFRLFLLSGLRLHLLYVDRVRFTPPHIQLVIAHTKRQDPLVDPHPGRQEYEVRRFLVDWFDYEFPIVEGNITDF